MHYIIAGTAEQAMAYANSINLGRSTWRYVYSAQQIYGIRDAHIHYAGEWRGRKDFLELYQEIEKRTSHIKSTTYEDM